MHTHTHAYVYTHIHTPFHGKGEAVEGQKEASPLLLVLM